MTLVNGQAERDVAIYRAWIDGATQADLAERYGVTQSAISYAIRRVLDDYPETDKAAEVQRTLDQVEELVAVYLPKALAGDAGANREYRGLAALKARYLGIDRREVEVHVDGQVQVQARPVEPMETVVERILAKALTTRGNGQDQDIVEAEIVEEAGNGG
jgi:Mor family transcriptional regulator